MKNGQVNTPQMSSNDMQHLHQTIEKLQAENAELKENLQYVTDEGIEMQDACDDKDDQINCQAAEIYDLEDEADKRKAELKECYQALRGIKRWMRHVPKEIVLTKTQQQQTTEQLIEEESGGAGQAPVPLLLPSMVGPSKTATELIEGLVRSDRLKKEGASD